MQGSLRRIDCGAGWATNDVIVDESHRLHERVRSGGSDEAKAPLFEIA